MKTIPMPDKSWQPSHEALLYAEGGKQAPVTLIKQSVEREGRAMGGETTLEQSPCGLDLDVQAKH